MAYLHHLIRAKEIVGMQLASEHNLAFYLWLMQQIRNRIEDGTFADWYKGMVSRVESKL